MARNPYAAEQLIEEVQALKPKAKVEASDEDGFEVYRTFTFDKATSTWLTPLLDVEPDARIRSLSEDKGKLSVTFVAEPLADYRDSFDLAAIDSVLNAKTQ